MTEKKTENKEEKKKEEKKEIAKNLKPILSDIKDKTLKLALERLSKEYKDYCPLYPRRIHEVRDIKSNKSQFKMMQFNILADGLSGVYNPNPPDHKTFIRSPKDSLYWKYRGFRICEEITRFSPDVITIEECDRFRFIEFYLKPHGYKGYLKSKKDSTCVKLGNRYGYKLPPDGVAIFYKKDKFELIGKPYEFGYDKNLDIEATGLGLHLVRKDKFKKHLFVFCSHFKSKKTVFGESYRLKQLNYLFKKLFDLQNNQFKNIKIPIFIGCDLNAPPINTKGFKPLAYKSIVNGENINKNLSKNDPIIPKDYIKNYGLNFSSAYTVGNFVGSSIGAESKYTTWKARKDKQDKNKEIIDKHTIDYIFYQKYLEIEVVNLLEIPDEKTVNQNTFLPSWEYPSDHFSIMATFNF